MLPALDEHIGQLQTGALIGRAQPDGRLELLDALVVLLIEPVAAVLKRRRASEESGDWATTVASSRCASVTLPCLSASMPRDS